jgi:hypothetical protein
VFDDNLNISVKSPECQDGLGQFRDVVAFQIDLGVASEAGRGLVSFDPFVIFEGRADSSFHFSEEGMYVVHTLLYPTELALIHHETCIDKYFGMDWGDYGPICWGI